MSEKYEAPEQVTLYVSRYGTLHETDPANVRQHACYVREDLVKAKDDLSRSQQNIIDAYEKSLTAIREALGGLSEFDDHEMVIDEIKLKNALLATQAERIAEYVGTINRFNAIIDLQYSDMKRLQSRLEYFRKLILDSRRPHGSCKRFGMDSPDRACSRCDALDAMDDMVEESAVEASLPCDHNWVDPSNAVVQAGTHRLCTKCGLFKDTAVVEAPLTKAEKFHVEMNDFLAGRDVPADPRNTREVWRDPDGFAKNSAPAVEKNGPQSDDVDYDWRVDGN